MERALLKVQIAEINLKVAKAKYDNGKTGSDEYNKAKFEHAIAVAEMRPLHRRLQI